MSKSMTKVMIKSVTMTTVVLCALAAPAVVRAQPAAGSAAPAGSAAAAPVAAEPAAVRPKVPDAAPAGNARETCVAAMNADPTFADQIVKVAEEKINKQIDRDTVKLHTEAQERVAKNEKHVILAYAALWVIAAGLLLFLWRRQQLLKTEIGQLRHDLEAAEKEAK